MKFFRDSWPIVKFGDVVRQCKESVDRDNNPFDRYVEGGHMDSENIHIRRWGTFGEDYVGPAFHRIFRKGQVLYGSRRTYLKKVAMAEFDGITANTTLVCETRDPDVLLQELLPFLMLTDAFTEHSIRESKGSTNPYINWPDIAKFEFPLPPLEEQKRIAEILWAADEAVENYVQSRKHTEDIRACEVELLLDSLECEPVPLMEVLSGSPESGCSAVPARSETGHWVLSLAALSSRGYVRDNLKPVKRTKAMEEATLRNGDLLISRSNTTELVGFAGIFNEDRVDVSFPDTMMRLPLDSTKVMPEYLEMVLLSPRGRKHMRRTASGTSSSMKKINRRTLAEFMLPVPSQARQRDIVLRCAELDARLTELNVHIEKLRAIYRRIGNDSLGAAHV